MSVESASRTRPAAWEDPRARNQALRAFGEAALGALLLGALARSRPKTGFWVGIAAGVLGASRLRIAANALAPQLEFEGSVLVDTPLEMLRSRLGDFSVWPKFMTGIESVTPNTDGTLSWQGRPLLTVKRPLQWKTEILHHSREEGIHWRSVPGERIRMEGSLLAESFSDLRSRVHAYLRLDPPFHPASTAMGSLISSLFGVKPLHVFEQDLERMQTLFALQSSSPSSTEEPEPASPGLTQAISAKARTVPAKPAAS